MPGRHASPTAASCSRTVACEQLTGFDRDELVGQHDRVADRGRRAGAARRTRARGAVPPQRGRRSSPSRSRLARIERRERLLVVTLRDVSELQAGREAQFEAEAKYRALVEQIPAVVYLDPVDENDIVDLREPADRDAGRHRARRVADRSVRLAPPRAPRRHRPRLGGVPGGLQRPHDAEPRVPHGARGRDRHAGSSSRPSRSTTSTASPWLIQGVIFDITERKQPRSRSRSSRTTTSSPACRTARCSRRCSRAPIARARRSDLGRRRAVPGPRQLQAGERLAGPPRRRRCCSPSSRDRLRSCTRETDLVARQGGDEFLLLLADLERGDRGHRRASERGAGRPSRSPSRVHEALRGALRPGRHGVLRLGSIGISLFPQDAQDARSLLKNADAAMYRSKQQAPGRLRVFADAAITTPRRRCR